MTNTDLSKDYAKRAKGRFKAVQTLFAEGLYADVVRECQEACELALKSIIRAAGHAVPMTHDVSPKLKEIEKDLPANVVARLDRACEISRSLRRDRELSFYGSEDVTPSTFYRKKDAEKAISELQEILDILP